MPQDLVMPKLGLTMTEGTLTEWRIQPGQSFRAGDVLAVVESEKIASDVEAIADGVMVDALVPAGDTVPVGTAIGRWSSVGAIVQTTERVRATPLARRRARELGVVLEAVAGSGPRGRIKAMDVEAAATATPSPSSRAARPRGDLPDQTHQPATATPQPAGPGTPTKPTPLQATMARRLTEAKRDTPHFYLASEAEISELLTLRQRLNADPGHPRLSLTHFVLAAVGAALRAMPHMDRVWRDDAIHSLNQGDIGLAIDTPRGLIAPVIHAAATLPLDRLAAAATALTDRARNAHLTDADTSGGAVTVSNAGMHNVTYMTPIIVPGQSSILGVGSVREVFRPDANGAPVLKRELGLVLAADHRLFDGVTALGFLNRIIAGLENPLRLLRAP